MLIEKVIADFLLGSMRRAQIMAATGEDAAPVAHTVAYMLLPFCRAMISRPTPGHVFTKPLAGTGASLLDELCAMIAESSPAPVVVPPKNEQEFAKTLTGLMRERPGRVRFDNVGDVIHSPDAQRDDPPTYCTRTPEALAAMLES